MIGGYVRVSTQGQKDNYSIDAQREDALAFAKKMKEEIIIFEDVQSGGDITRTGWNKMLSDVSAKKIDKVWVGAIDRFSRKTTDGLNALEAMSKANAEFYVAGVKYDPNDPNTQLLVTVEFAIGQYEKSRILQRTTTGKIKAYNEGKRKAARVYGFDYYYDATGKRHVKIHQQEAEVVKIIFKKYQEGMSFKKIASFLNDQAYPTKLARRKQKSRFTNDIVTNSGNWSATHIAYMLRRPEYAGLTWNFEKTALLPWTGIDPGWPPIIQPETWKRVQESIGPLAAERNRNGIKFSDFELSGILKCPYCNAAYYKHGEKYYMHKGDNSNQLACENSPKYVNREKAESFVQSVYFSIFTDPNQLAKLYQSKKDVKGQADDERVVELLKSQIEEVKKKEIKMIMLFESRDDDELIKERIDELKLERQKLTDKMNKKLLEIAKRQNEVDKLIAVFVGDQLGEFMQGSGAQKRRIYHSVIDYVHVDHGKLIVKFKVGGKKTFDLKNETIKMPWNGSVVLNKHYMVMEALKNVDEATGQGDD